MAEPNTSWASYAVSGANSAYGAARYTAEYAATGASTAYGAAANAVGPWASSAASGASNAYSTVSPLASSAVSGVYSGASSACDAVKRTVWASDTVEENARNTSTAVGVATKKAVGVFTRLNSVGKQPIYGHVSGGTLGWRQLNDAGKGAIFRPTAYNPWFTGLGYASLGGAIAIDSYEIYQAVQKDYSEGSYTNTAVKGATVAGTWAGAIPGILGAVYGAWGGEAAAKSLLPSTENEKKKGEQAISLPAPNNSTASTRIIGVDKMASWIDSAAAGMNNGIGAVKKSVWGESAEEKKGMGAAVAAGVKNVTVGVFRQINTVGEPIFKHVSGSTLGWRQINEAGKGAIYKPTSTNGLFSSLSWATFFGAAGFDLFRFGQTAKKDYEEGGNYDNTTVMGASIAGAWAGAINGGAVGASALSVVPGVGTVVGGVAGGVLGAVCGAKGGEALAKALLPEEKRKSWMETIRSKL